MLDKRLVRKKLIMRLPAAELERLPGPSLPPGHSFATYAQGREADWARIETAVGEFQDEAAAREYFRAVFLSRPREARRRVVFALAPDGEALGTASAWFAYKDGAEVPCLHWVAVHPRAQGRGLGRALSLRALSMFGESGQHVYLSTQTWSHPAIRLYHELGFRICTRETISYDAIERGRLVTKEAGNDYDAAMEILEGVIDDATLALWRAEAS